MIGVILVFISVFFSALASIFLKLNSVLSTEKTGFFYYLLNFNTFLGLMCYGLSFLCYVFVLRHVPLAMAQPAITVGASVVTSIAAVILFKEDMSFFNIVGLILIFIGVFFLFFKS